MRVQELFDRTTKGPWTKGKGFFLIREEEANGRYVGKFIARTRDKAHGRWADDQDEINADFIARSRKEWPEAVGAFLRYAKHHGGCAIGLFDNNCTCGLLDTLKGILGEDHGEI